MPLALKPHGYELKKGTEVQKEWVVKLYSSQSVDRVVCGEESGALVMAVAIVVYTIVLAALAKQVDLGDCDITKFIDEQIAKIPGLDLSALTNINI